MSEKRSRGVRRDPGVWGKSWVKFWRFREGFVGAVYQEALMHTYKSKFTEKIIDETTEPCTGRQQQTLAAMRDVCVNSQCRRLHSVSFQKHAMTYDRRWPHTQGDPTFSHISVTGADNSCGGHVDFDRHTYTKFPPDSSHLHDTHTNKICVKVPGFKWRVVWQN